MRTLLVLFIYTCFGWQTSAQSPKVEIYLAKGKTNIVNRTPAPFTITENELPDKPFITDSEILGYNLNTYELRFSPDGTKKIGALQPNLPVGIPFVLTVNRKPVITGYFTNLYSSFSTGAYSITATTDSIQAILKGVPEHHFATTLKEVILIPHYYKHLEYLLA